MRKQMIVAVAVLCCSVLSFSAGAVAPATLPTCDGTGTCMTRGRCNGSCTGTGTCVGYEGCRSADKSTASASACPRSAGMHHGGHYRGGHHGR